MLKSFMEDIGISEEQFTKACTFDTRHMKSDMHTTVFEQVWFFFLLLFWKPIWFFTFLLIQSTYFIIAQVWAADEYEVFKRMMIQKNIELQLQALELLQQK